MDYSVSRSRLGGGGGGSAGPQMVKTYGRFRQRIVNREAKVAEEFARMTGARPFVSNLLDPSSDSDFETPPQPSQASLPLAKESPPETRPVVEPAATKAARAKRPKNTDSGIAAISSSAKSSKSSGPRARKPKPLEADQAPPEQTKPLGKLPSSAAHHPKAKRTRKKAKPANDTPELPIANQQEPGTRFEGQGAIRPSSPSLADDQRAPSVGADMDSDLPDGLVHAPVPTIHQFAEQAIAAPEFPTEATPKRTTRARTSSASNHSSTMAQGRPRKASRLHADTNTEPFAGAITAARSTLEDPITSPIEPPLEPSYVVAVSSGDTRNGTAYSVECTDLATDLVRSATAESESLRIEQSPISGGNVTRRRTTARGRRPAAVDRASAVANSPILTEITDARNDSPPNGSLDSMQVSTQPTQPVIASTADTVVSDGRRRSSRLMRLPPDEARRESSARVADAVMASVPLPVGFSTNDAHREQHSGTLKHEEEDDGLVQQRQHLGTRPMRFKAPRNARVQTYEMDDNDHETQLGGITESNTQYDLLSTPTRHSTTIRSHPSNADSSPISIPLPQPILASQSNLPDRHDSPLETPSIHSQHTPPRSQQGSRRDTDHLRTPVRAATPRKDWQPSASYLPDVPHSPLRVATPHRVIYSPQHPMTHFKPAAARASHGGDMPSAMSSTAQPGSTPGAMSGRVRISGASLPEPPPLRLGSGSATGRMSASGGDVTGELEIEETRVPFLPARRYVQKTHILAACGQTAPIDWVSGGLQACGVLLPELDPAQLSDVQMGEMESESGLCKIGEATYSEVFSAQWRYVPRTRYDNFNSKRGKVKGERLMQVALKVIPFGNSAVKSGTGEPQTTLRDLYQEIGATLALSRLSERERAKLQEARMQVEKPLKPKERELGANFVKAFRVCICQGPLPAPLLRAWDRWKAEYPDLCENMRPDYYPPNQLFAVFVLEMGGETLENATVSTWKEARSIIRQLALSMALAERHNQFEHRDLHWGNIMVTRSNSNLTFLYQLPPTGARLKSALMSIPSYKVRCTIIDYTLSRLHIDNDASDAAANKPANYDPAKNVFYVALKDEALFQGQGDIQYDVYRQMRQCSKNDWEGFHPHTNVLWLSYTLLKILETKDSAIKHELLEFAESRLGPAFDAVPSELKRAAGQELLKRWIREFEQCESTSDVLKCALLDLYKS
ncbi:hypothetical protein IWW37_000621 [Coemansia sp. RSA 2050]|nr:hypothetical protein IWW37_000621 [Coemansia sp. RSA 2050]